MKILNKFKRGFLLLTLFLGFVLIGYGVSLSVNAKTTDTNNKFPTITYSYKAYTKEAWDAHENIRIMDSSGMPSSLSSVSEVKAILAQYEGMPNTPPKKNFFLTGAGAKFKSYYNLKQNADGSYSDTETTDDWTEHSRGTTSEEVYNALKAEIAAIETNFENGVVNKLVSGQDMVIAAYATTSDGSDIWSIQVALDIMSIIDGTPTYYENTASGATNFACGTVGTSSKAARLGFGWQDSSQGSVPSPAYVGAVAFKVSPSASDISVGFAKGANLSETLFGCTGSTDTSNPTITYNQYGVNFNETPLELKGAAVSTNTNLETLTVNSGTNLAASDSGAGPSYTAPSEITGTSATVYAKVKDSGTIFNTGYVHTSAPNLASPTSSNSVSISGGTFNVDMSSVATGSSVWVTFQAVASDNTTKKWYSIQLTKAKSKDANLEGVSITCESGGTLTILNKTASDLTGTTTFDVYYPTGANNFKITPTAATLSKTLQVNGVDATSGTATNITVSDGGTVTVTVKAQDDSVTKTYTFKFHETSSKPDSVSAASGQPVKTVTGVWSGDTATMDNMAPGRDSFDLTITFPSDFPSTATVVLKGAESNPVTLTLSGGSVTKSGITYGAGYTGTNAYLAATKTMTLEVTLVGMPTQTYTLVVKRPAITNDTNIVFTSTSYNNLTGGGTTTITIPATGNTHTVSNLPYNTPKVNFTISMSDGSSKTEIISNTISDTSAQNVKINGIAQTLSLPTGPSALSTQYQFYVKTELQAAQGSSGTLHTIVFNENPADSTKTFKTVNVIGNSGAVTKKSSTTTGTTVTDTYALDPTNDGTTFTVDMTWDDPTKTKAYIGTTPNPTTPYDATSKGPFNVGDTVYLVLEAEDGTKITRIIKSETKKSSDNGIVNVKIEDVPTTGTANTLLDTPITSSKLSYAYPDITKVVYGTKKVKFTVTVSNAKAALTIGGTTTPTGSTTRTVELNITGNSNLYTVVCTAEDGTVGSTYNFTVEREAAFTDSYIESLTIGGIDCMTANATYFNTPFSKTASSFVMTLPCNFTNNSVGFTVSNRASYTVTISGSGTPLTGAHPTAGAFNFVNPITDNSHYSFTITVVSEKDRIDGTTTSSGTHTYNFDIYVGDKTTELDGLDLVKTDGTALASTSSAYLDITNYSSYATAATAFEVPYDIDKVKIAITEKTGFHGTVTYNGGTNPEISLTAGSAVKITVKVTSELASLDSSKFGTLVKNYVFYVKRKDCDHDQTLSNLEVKIDGVAQSIGFLPTKFSYVIENLTGGSTITLNGTPNDASSTVSGNGDTAITGLDYNPALTSATTETFKVSVSCKCGSKTPQVYSITLSTKPYVKDNNPGSLSFTASTAKGTAIGASTTPPFSVGTTSYTIKLSNQTSPEDNYVNFDIVKAVAKSSVYFNDGGTDQSTTSSTVTYSTTGIPLGGSRTVKIWTLAEDGTTKGTEYTITITRDAAASTDNELASLSCNGNPVSGFSKTNVGPYDVKIGNLDYAYFNYTTSDGKATVTNPFDSYANRYTFSATEFSHTFPIVVTAEDGSTKTYTVVVTRDDKTILDNLDAKVDGTSKLAPNYNSSILEYTVTLGLKENSVVLEYTPNNINTKVSILNPSGAAVTYSGTSYTVSVPSPTFDAAGTDTPLVYTVVVTAASGAKTEYKVKISKERGSDDAYITSFEYLQTTGAAMETLGMTTGVYKYEYRVDRDITVFNPDTGGNVKITLNDPSATYTVTSNRNLVAGKKNTINVEVVPASGDATKKKVYTFDVYPCSNDFTLNDIRALLSDQSDNLLDVDKTSYIDYQNSVLSITVPHGTANILQTYLKVTSSADNHKVFLDGSEMSNPIQNLIVGTNTFKLRVVSDYAAAYFAETGTLLTTYCSPEVTVTIIRKDLSHDATLKTLTVTYTDDDGNTQTKSFDGLPGNGLFTLPYLGDNVTNVTIAATPNDTQATVIGTGSKQLTDGTTDASGNYNFTVRCTAEDGTTYLDYPIAIARGKIDLNKDNSILEITVEAVIGTDKKVYLAGSDFDPDITDYGVFKIPFKAQSYVISVKKPDGTYSKTWIDGQNVNSLTTPITDAMRGTTKDVLVYAIAQDSTVGKGKEYKIKLEFEEASTNANLSSLKADGTTVPGFDPDVLEYTLPARPNSTEVINIEYETSDPKATVTGDTGVQQLKEGNNTFVVVVKAESGASKTYRIYVQRDYPLPYLTDLAISGEKLLDSNYKTTEFAKEEYNYTAIVSYTTLHATIHATVDNKDFIVTCSNSTINTVGDFLRTFDVDLAEGLNNFAITVTSPENKTVTYNLVIKRRGEASTNTDIADIDIKEDPKFKDKYNNETREYDIEVPNGIRNLTIDVKPEKLPDADGEGATVKIINNKNLRVGPSTVVILVTAEDGETTRAVLLNVNRREMSYEIDTDAYSAYPCEKQDGADNRYTIKLGDKLAKDISDYTKYITFPDKTNYPDGEDTILPEVTVLSDTSDEKCSEVIICIDDGDKKEFITFELESTSIGNGGISNLMKIIIPWILLAIAIIILILILICVNRDKFGAINKKRKKDEE